MKILVLALTRAEVAPYRFASSGGAGVPFDATMISPWNSSPASSLRLWFSA